VIGMRVGQQEGMERGQTTDRNPRRSDPREKTAQALTKVWIGEDTNTTEVQQQSGVAYVRDTQLRRRCVNA
jgi:hypothetical protein